LTLTTCLDWLGKSSGGERITLLAGRTETG
jgi:hypothetical protein